MLDLLVYYVQAARENILGMRQQIQPAIVHG